MMELAQSIVILLLGIGLIMNVMVVERLVRTVKMQTELIQLLMVYR